MNNKKLKPLPPFKNFVLENFPFIEEDFDALTNYELLCHVVNYVKTMGNEFNDIIINVEALNNWFNNLDVQDEIDNKLDQMVEDGTLQEIVADYLNSKAVFGFDNVASMKESTNLINGSYAQTLGYYEKNDGGLALYKIREITNEDVVDEMTIIALSNENLIAELIIKDSINLKELGAYGDGDHDDTKTLNKALSYNNIIIPEGTYLCDFSGVLINEKTISGMGSKSIIKQRNSNIPFIKIGQYCNLKDFNIITNNSNETPVFILGTYNNAFDKCNNHYIDNVNIIGDENSIGFDFNYLTNGGTGGIIQNCNVAECKGGIRFKFTSDSTPKSGWLTAQSIENVKIRSPYVFGFKIERENTYSNPQFTNCKFSEIMVDIENNGDQGCVGFALAESGITLDSCYVFCDNYTGTCYSVDFGTIASNKTWSLTNSILNCIFEGLLLNEDYKYLYHITNTKFYKRPNTNPASTTILDTEDSQIKPLFEKSIKEMYDDSQIELGNCTATFESDDVGYYMKITPTNVSSGAYFRLKIPATYFTDRGYYPKITAVVNYNLVGSDLSASNIGFFTGISAIDNTPLFARKSGLGLINNKNFKYMAYYANLSGEESTTPSSSQFIQMFIPANWSSGSSYIKVYSMNIYDVVTSFNTGCSLKDLIYK